MTDRFVAAAVAALFLLAAAPLHAAATQPVAAADGSAPAKAAPSPVEVSANEMEILDKDKKAVFRGAVDATRGTTNLKADTLTVTYAEVKQPDGSSKTDATDLDARGNVTITTPKETITGDWAKIDPQGNKLVVGGKVKLVQGSTVLQGDELHADLKTGKIQMTGGRVKGSFLPK